jgi:hypothetical protein
MSVEGFKRRTRNFFRELFAVIFMAISVVLCLFIIKK